MGNNLWDELTFEMTDVFKEMISFNCILEKIMS